MRGFAALLVWVPAFTVLVSDHGTRARSTSLPAGQRVTVTVYVETGQTVIDFHLCSITACSGLLVGAVYTDRSLAYEAKVDEASDGLLGRQHHRRYELQKKNNWSPFSSNTTYVFEVEHRADQLAVWLKGFPDKAAMVPTVTGATMDRLLVWPHNRAQAYFIHFTANSEKLASSSLNTTPEAGSCGRAVAGPTSLVQDGEKTPIETVPWHAGIFIERDGRIENVCGGTLVAPCVVVTAAHCIPEGKKMFVGLGKFLSGWDLESGKNIHKTQVKKSTKHPFFKGFLTKLAFDIAVLELEHCSSINSTIGTVCMDKNIEPVSSAEIKVAGWGNESTPLKELESVTVTQLNFADCLNVMSASSTYAAYITFDKFCAQRQKGMPKSGLLQGDSGGAALVKRAGSWYMTGVVSSRLKDENNEDVYALTKVSEYVDWIQGFM